MVEANPSQTIAEHLSDLEEQIFCQIDDEIREFHGQLKDLVQEFTQRIEDLSRRHIEIANLSRD